MKAVIVCGDRHGTFTEWAITIRRQLDEFRRGELLIVLHGGQHGVDSIADFLCRYYEDRYTRVPFPVSKQTWREVGSGAGPQRNYLMASFLKLLQQDGADVMVFAFHSRYEEKSKGTRNMIRQAKTLELPYVLFTSPTDAFQLNLTGVGAGSSGVADSDDDGGVPEPLAG